MVIELNERMHKTCEEFFTHSKKERNISYCQITEEPTIQGNQILMDQNN